MITVDMTGDQLNDGPVLTSPMGGLIVYTGPGALNEAEDAAKQLVRGGTVKGAYVQLLRPVAFYMPDAAGRVPNAEDPVREDSN